MQKLFLFLFTISVSLYAYHTEITLQQISSKPTSRAKDFLIWQYLKQRPSDTEAKIAYEQASKHNNKVKRLYQKRAKDPYIIYTKKCKKKRNLFDISDKKCFKLALSPYKTLALSNTQRVELSQKIESKHFIKLLDIQNEPYSVKAYKDYPADIILKMFIYTTASHRNKHLNIDLDYDFINHLTSSKKIHYFIKMVMRNNQLDRLQKSLLRLNPKLLNKDDNFKLALFNLKFHRTIKAIKHLNAVSKKAKKRYTKDKVNFWYYQILKQNKYLNRLIKSTDINIYTLYAHEKKGIKVSNYFSSLQTNNSKCNINIQDPFEWAELRKKIKTTPKKKLKSLTKQYKQKSMLPVQSFIVERLNSFRIHGYIMPYDKYLQNVSLEDKALIYAIMRQESNFIPSALSRSFALGLMQIMPFLTDALSKEMKLKTCYSDMFNPKINIKYAIKHLEWMKKSLYHPLFLAYAYNGGIGFFRKHLKSGAFKKGDYEPFLSMELMQNSQSREYGKRVLANYVMYRKILGKKVSIIHLFQTLTNPKKTDRFGRRN